MGIVIVAINRAVNMIVGVVVRTYDIGCSLGLLDVIYAVPLECKEVIGCSIGS